ncbi:MAG: hypothetical protein M0R06_21825 [Sphaerochaeta sp.]|jgi:hypothetical protein|nr:hypothetical protein [Sphaerochaeta sp.]
MTLHEWRAAENLHRADPPFYALIMAAMWKADTDNRATLMIAFPETWNECHARYDAPGGLLPGEVEG